PEVCQGDALANFIDTTLIADGSTGMTYRWNFNAGTTPISPAPMPGTGSAKNPTVRYNIAGNYFVQQVVTSAVGCVDSITKPFTVNGAVPKADFNILTTNGLCSNAPVEIQNTSSVDFGVVTKLEVYWDYDNQPGVFVNDDNPAPNKIYRHTYPNFQTPLTQNFRIRVRAFSGGTCVDDEIKTVVVNASPLTQFNAIPEICLDASPIQITQASELGGLAGVGTFTGNGISASGLFNPATAGVGVHTLRFTYNAANGCSMFSERTIEVWPRPVSDFELQSPSCEKNQVSFKDLSVHNATSLTTWQWNFGDGSPLFIENNISNARHVFAQYNDYDVTLQVINNRGCTSVPVTKRITIHPLPLVDFTLPIVCLPEGKALFTNLSSIPGNTINSMQYRWNFGDAAASPMGSDTSLLKDPIYFYKNLGTYNVQLIAISAEQCVDSTT
ncbi:MAG: PKD domain-containing protein, partial [Chitinophagaceae bacterium]